MLTWVRGLPVGLWMGMAWTSILEVEIAGCGSVVEGVVVWGVLSVALRLEVWAGCEAGLVAASEAAVRWGMFLISL